MFQEVIKSKSFFINESNQVKLDQITDKAHKILDFKNLVANNLTLDDLVSHSKFDAIKKFNTQIDGVSGQEIQIAIGDIFDFSSNKINEAIDSIKFKVQDKIIVTKYVKSTKKNKVGDVKTFEVKMKETLLSKALTYISKFYNEGLIDYVKTQLETNTELKEPKRKMYENILRCYNKFGDRLMTLAIEKHNRIIKNCFNKTVKIKSLSYRSLNRLSRPILGWNKNKNSESCNSFINLGIVKGETTSLPTKYSLDYHGLMKNYQDYEGGKSYQVVFNGNKPSRIVIQVKENEEVVDCTTKTNYIGVDINIKHNLFYTSTNEQIDFDRNELEGYVKFLKHLDDKKASQEQQELSAHDADHMKHWLTRIKSMINRKCHDLVQLAVDNGKDHIVLEDLQSFGKGFIFTDEEFHNIKYSRLVKLMNLCNVKNVIKSIANKRGLKVTFIQSHYTSQTCPICGCIDRDNRKTQECFCCVECGYSCNADYNSATNICNRMYIDDLRTALMNFDEIEGYSPKPLSKVSIINHLYTYYNNREVVDETVTKCGCFK